jgi:hypothetical protein
MEEHNENPSAVTGGPPLAPAAGLARGVARLFANMGWRTLAEFSLANGRRCDLVALDRQGRFAVIEIKSSTADFRADGKWREYLPYCDAFYFAVAADFPIAILPADVGIIVADTYDSAIVREAPTQHLHAGRRRALTLRFARTAAARLEAVTAAAAGDARPAG